jgi:hypothetical protein
VSNPHPKPRPTIPVLTRLLNYRRIVGDCWEWTGGRDSWGYGKIKIQGRQLGVHRVALHIFKEFDLANPLQVLHTCDNRRCFNPEHLFIGTQLDNVQDCIAKGRFSYNFKAGKMG